MVVGCPKCKARLRVSDEKIKPEGSKFKCPKCRALLLVKKQPGRPASPPPEMPREAPPPPRPEEQAPAPEEAPFGTPPFPEETVEGPEEQLPPPPEEPFEERVGQEPAPEPRPSQPEAPAPGLHGEPSAGMAPALDEAVKGAPPVFEEPAAAPPFMEAPEEEEAPEAGAKVLVAHSKADLINMLKFVLSGANFTVINATDGVTAMIKAMKEHPDAVVVDVTLPKIHGIEIMKRLKSRAETRDAKIILVGTKPEEQVTALYGADAYIHQDRMQMGLVELLKSVLAPEEPPAAPPKEAAAPAVPGVDPGIAKAQRFCRTVFADIYLYNTEKANEAIRAGIFGEVFAKEIGEGLKLYEMRIPEDVRSRGDFYNEALNAFVEKKKQELGL